MPQLLFNQILDETLQLHVTTTRERKEEVYNYIFKLATPDHRKNDRVLITEGNVAANVYFLLRGTCRFFYYSKSRKQDLIPFLQLSPCLLAEGRSMQKNIGARFNISVNEGSIVYVLSKAAIAAIEQKYAEDGICIDQLVKCQIHEFKLWKKRLNSHLPAQRYLKLKHKRPEVEKYSLKKDIAGHLGIKDTSYSRMLKRLSK